MAINYEELKKKYDAIQKKKEGNNQGGDFSEKFVKLEEGTTLVRILPAKEEGPPFYAESAIHRISSGEGGFVNVHCREYNEGKECPLCNLYYHAWQRFKDNPAKIAFARSIKPRPRYYMNVIQIDNPESRGEGKVKILSVGEKLYEKILGAIFDEDFGDVTDLEKGWDLKIHMEIEKTPTGNFPKYDKSSFRPKSEPAGTKAEIARWMDELHDLSTLIKVLPYEDILEIARNSAPEGLDPLFKRKGKIKVKGNATPTELAAEATSDDYLSKLKTK